VPGAVHEDLPQQRAVARVADHAAVGLLVLRDHQAVAGGVHGQHRDGDLAVERDVVLQVLHRRGVGADLGGVLDRCQVLAQVRPCLVFCAAAAAWIAPVRLAPGLVMFTTVTDGSISCWKANAASAAVFQVATPPDSTPHMGRAALNRLGYRWIRPAVMMPPSEWPQAMVRAGCW